MTEDDLNNNVASGTVDLADVDTGEAGAAADSVTTDYGVFTVDAAGAWSFVLDNGLPAVQALGEGVTHVETFTITSIDGTASQDVSVTITGAGEAGNDVPDRHGDISGDVTEDDPDLNQASGTVLFADDDPRSVLCGCGCRHYGAWQLHGG